MEIFSVELYSRDIDIGRAYISVRPISVIRWSRRCWSWPEWPCSCAPISSHTTLPAWLLIHFDSHNNYLHRGGAESHTLFGWATFLFTETVISRTVCAKYFPVNQYRWICPPSFQFNILHVFIRTSSEPVIFFFVLPKLFPVFIKNNFRT